MESKQYGPPEVIADSGLLSRLIENLVLSRIFVANHRIVGDYQGDFSGKCTGRGYPARNVKISDSTAQCSRCDALMKLIWRRGQLA
ncbi:hypothetical protein A2954_01430 [Candidatus Roizmanbacteria bacterium RIFCSPLOWO2_01_FULL_37_12]|uniref:Uncharacterized protein n=1 Tax=Candidatus Roizmanbacteria bacterium RIFCSPLOWO2_01_FULL_37_12 TaxID=1802056 RepID=A0A1F7IGM4_9BACT|nr:MAG: hypothetical protein A3D76_00495 [Candidatus Roizmanbacteria bacterium RIFCSPHIGHO2_02_FULL_37_9b]OGK42485.1 MAG: hypothetical protein A2954_01430 [Candidatus Roizmanbacteria bacterium RIFCSPLOWO2_01_FULL_37_12]